MTNASNPLRLWVLSPQGTLLDTAVLSVKLNAVDGSRGVHKGHPTALIMLAHGKLSYLKDGENHSMDVKGVFAEVKNDTVTVITE